MRTTILISLIFLLIATPALATRDMTGSTCVLVTPATGNLGETVVFMFAVCNHSPDNEWTSNLILTFPECFTVLDGWWDDGDVGSDFDVVIDPANVIAFMDGDGGWGEIYQDYCFDFFVEATIGADCPTGTVEIHWEQQGDGFGEEPHTITGTMSFTIGVTPIDTSTWSRVKSLY